MHLFKIPHSKLDIFMQILLSNYDLINKTPEIYLKIKDLELSKTNEEKLCKHLRNTHIPFVAFTNES